MGCKFLIQWHYTITFHIAIAPFKSQITNWQIDQMIDSGKIKRAFDADNVFVK